VRVHIALGLLDVIHIDSSAGCGLSLFGGFSRNLLMF
jgi:hypothetical protein